MKVSREVPFRKPGFISRAFPAPAFLWPPIAGLEISDAALRYAVLKLGKDGVEIARKGKRTIPEGVVKAGEILKPDVLIDNLRALAGDMRVGHVYATVPDELSYLFKVQIPKAPPAEIRNSIEFHLDENVPVQASEIVFEYAEITRSKHVGEDHLDMSVCAFPKAALASYSDALRAASLEPVSFYTPSEALLRAYVKPADQSTRLIIHFGVTKTLIAVASEGVVRYSTTVAVGIDTLVSALMRNFSCSKDEAARMLSEKGFFKTGDNAEFYASLLSTVAVICDETRKVMSYWDNHGPTTNEADQRIVGIFLSGTCATLRGLDEFLTASLQKNTEPANVWQNIFDLERAIPPLPLVEALEYAIPIGLAAIDIFN